ncbi:uncharacterized protein LOC142416082 [Mycteria americana]|uniref:uncharacterized protein LOC142416082 n=1 Tax=Mycteria americana TaxID=33587 RepID=UPI003F585DA1
MAWVRGFAPQVHLLHVTWCHFGLPLLWQCRLPPPHQHQGCSNTSRKTNLGRQWGKYLTCPAPDHCRCAACRSQGSWAGTLAQGEPSCRTVLPACLARGAGCVLGHTKPRPPRDAQCKEPGAHVPLCQQTWGAQLLGHPALEMGSCTPRSWHQCPQCARDLGLAGSPSWQPPSPCPEAPAQLRRQDQGLALCTLCGAPIKQHGLRSPSCGSSDKWLGQNSSWLFGAQWFFGQAEPRESAAEPGRCPLPRNASCLRTRHGMGAGGSESLRGQRGQLPSPSPPCTYRPLRCSDTLPLVHTPGA